MMLDCAKEGAGSGAGGLAARAGHRSDACGEGCSQSRHGLTGAAVAAWPAVALVGSYELLMLIIRSGQMSEDASPVPTLSGYRGGDDPICRQAVEIFADQLAEGRLPSVRLIRAQLHLGQSRAQRVRSYLNVLTNV